MCLASRLSTQANLGNMTTRREVLNMVVGNIALVQVQAIVASFIVAVSIHYTKRKKKFSVSINFFPSTHSDVCYYCGISDEQFFCVGACDFDDCVKYVYSNRLMLSFR